jgi:flagellin
LLEEADNIAKTTSFNGQKLLDGTFTNKNFHIGAYANETVKLSISNAQISNVGAHVDATSSAVTSVALAAGDLKINGTDVGATATVTAAAAHDGSSAWAKAAAINSVSDKTHVTATASTTVTGTTAIAAGTITAGGLKINGVNIGAVTVSTNDADNALVNAINAVSNQTNVVASHSGGKLVLTATDGSNIVISGATAESTITKISIGVNTGKITLTSDNAVTIGGTAPTKAGFSAQTISTSHALNSIDVQTRSNAESAIKTTDSALRQIDTLRSTIGSVQNQLESTVRNISVTQINVTAARSTIMDVDFAAESAAFAKHNILAQSGSYALSQANAVQQNVLRLLQ